MLFSVPGCYPLQVISLTNMLKTPLVLLAPQRFGNT
jgi:hypothetical protein